MTQLERIAYMEQILDEATEAVAVLETALERYCAMQEKLQKLSAYYTGSQWLQDFDDDSAGKLPVDLKRGVLSEDAVYNLLTDNDRLREALLDAGHRIPEQE